MKVFFVLAVALFIVPASFATEESAVPAVELSGELLPAESCAAESSAPSSAATNADATASMKVETAALYQCEEICRCFQLQTAPVTRVAATCLRARQRAAAAARTLAVCPPNSNGKCGPTTHSVDPCVPITNGFSATAVATYHCEVCIERCY